MGGDEDVLTHAGQSTARDRALLSALRAALVGAGLHRRATGRVLAELAFHLLLLFGGASLFFGAAPAALRAAGLLLAALGSVGLGTNTHTSAHGATSEKRWVNDLLSLAGYPVLLGLPLAYWRHKHNGLHHSFPNVDGLDPDHDFVPFFALARSQVAERGFFRACHRHLQGYLFVPSALLMGPSMRLRGLRYAIGRLRDTKPARRGAAADLGAFGLHLALWLVLPALLFSPVEAVVLYAARDALLSVALFGIFVPAHIPRECAYYARDGAPPDLVLRQTATTVDFRAGRLAGFFLSGLQFQIEHHLFPGLSHVHYARLGPLVREALTREGYPYRELGWGEALVKSVRVAFDPKPVAALPVPEADAG